MFRSLKKTMVLVVAVGRGIRDDNDTSLSFITIASKSRIPTSAPFQIPPQRQPWWSQSDMKSPSVSVITLSKT